MAEPNSSLNSSSSEESVKLFVGQVPKHMTEAELLSIFNEFAFIDEINIIKDKSTRISRGCCFLICPSRQEADKAVNEFHNKKTLPGASSPLQVKYADGELERLEHKLFVGMLPKNVTNAEVLTLFSKYGSIKDLQILRGGQQTSKGCAFLKYETKEQALAALEAINGKYKMEGSSIPLVVKWADTEKERQARKTQKAQFQASGLSSTDLTQHPSLFGALPMGHIPLYNGYGYQIQPGFCNMVPPFNRVNAVHEVSPDLAPCISPRSFPLGPSGYIRSGYPAIPGLQYPMFYPGGMINQGHSNNSHDTVSPGSTNYNLTLSSSIRKSSGVQVEGPTGANLFIYHIPQEFGDEELAIAFQRFGRVLSAKVFVDKATSVSKCFGFVSYDLPEAAQSAINVMNGYQTGGKKLKVQLKRDKKQSKLY